MRILEARRINLLMGGVAVMPWEIDQLPDDYRMGFQALSEDLPEIQKSYQELDNTFRSVTARFQRRQ